MFGYDGGEGEEGGTTGDWGGGFALRANLRSDFKIFDFGSQYYGCVFWCILDGIFFTVQLPVLHAKPEFNRYRRIKAVMVSR